MPLPPAYIIDAWKKKDEQQRRQDEDSRRLPAPPPPSVDDRAPPPEKPHDPAPGGWNISDGWRFSSP